jgi:hypothetical protein
MPVFQGLKQVQIFCSTLSGKGRMQKNTYKKLYEPLCMADFFFNKNSVIQFIPRRVYWHGLCRIQYTFLSFVDSLLQTNGLPPSGSFVVSGTATNALTGALTAHPERSA